MRTYECVSCKAALRTKKARCRVCGAGKESHPSLRDSSTAPVLTVSAAIVLLLGLGIALTIMALSAD
jgi:hypothetical protein